MSQRISLTESDGREKRVLNAKFEVRSAEDSPSKVVGYAALFNKRSENFGNGEYPFFEVIAPGAFRDVLNDDVRAVIDHQGGLQTLARTKSGTLKLSEDELGLRFEFEAPNTQAGRDIIEILKRGDIDQASFAFTVSEEGQSFEDITEDGKAVTVRTVNKISRLYDVSPVTYPAYPDTLVQARSFEKFLHERKTTRNNDKAEIESAARARHLEIIEKTIQ